MLVSGSVDVSVDVPVPSSVFRSRKCPSRKFSELQTDAHSTRIETASGATRRLPGGPSPTQGASFRYYE